MGAEQIAALTEETFDLAIARDETAVVLFGAAWCSPCGMMEALLAEIAEDVPEDVRFYRVDTDQQHALCDRFSILSLPTILFLRGGVERARSAGPRPRRAMLELIEGTRA